MKRKLIFIGMGVVLCATLIIAAYNRAHCSYTGWQLDRQTRFAPLVGCLVKTKDGWFPLQQLREME